MNLNDVVFTGIETAFLAAKDFVSIGSYTYSSTAPVYDPVNDTMTSGLVTVQDVRMIKTSTTLEEREASPVTINDIKVLIPAVDLPGVRPSETDTFSVDGVGYNVLAVKTVPGNSLWIIMAREK